MSEDALIDPAQPNALSGDARFSKMYGAKQVLSRVIAANESKVSFQFGRYTQPFAAMTLDATPMAGTVPPAAPGRFHYTTTNTLSPGMTTGTIVDLRSYVVPAAGDHEHPRAGGERRHRHPHRAASRPAAMPPEWMLATEIQTQMDAAPLTLNTYTVTYLANHRFQIARATGTRSFSLRWTTSNGDPPHRARVQQRRRHRRAHATRATARPRATSTSSVRTRPPTTRPTGPRSTTGPTRAGTSTARSCPCSPTDASAA